MRTRNSILILLSLSTPGLARAQDVLSIPPKAIQVDEGLVHRIVVGPAGARDFSLSSAPPDAEIGGDGTLVWNPPPNYRGPAEFDVEVSLDEGGSLRTRFTIWVTEQLDDGAPRLLVGDGVSAASALLEGGEGAVIAGDAIPRLCPPGISMSSHESRGTCRSENLDIPIGPWVVVDRNCERADCLRDHRYLEIRLSGHLADAVQTDVVPRILVFVTHDWARGEPVWYPVGAVEATSVPEVRSLLAGLGSGVEALLIAREGVTGGPAIALSELSAMEASDVTLSLGPLLRRPSRRDWAFAEHGFGPADEVPTLAARSLAMLLGRHKLRSWIRSASPGHQVELLGRADELEAILAWDEVRASQVHRSFPDLDAYVTPNTTDRAVVSDLMGFRATGWTISIGDTDVAAGSADFRGGILSAACTSLSGDRGYCSLPCGSRSSLGENHRLCVHGHRVASAAAGDGVGIAQEAGILSYRFRAVTETSVIRDLVDRVQRGERIAAHNMSYGSPGSFFSTTTGPHQKWRDLLRHGIAPVKSAGNLRNGFQVGANSSATNLIRVSSVDANDCIADHSKSAPIVPLAARGEDVEVLNWDGGRTRRNGTSFAAPRVAGAIAVLRAVRPECSPRNLLRVLEWTGRVVEETRASPPYTIRQVDLTEALAQLPTFDCEPEAPSNVRVFGLTRDSARVEWTDEASNEDGFEVEAVGNPPSALTIPRRREYGPNRRPGARSPVPGELVPLEGLQPGTDYCIRVRAFRVTGPSQRIYSDWAAAQDASGSCAVQRTMPAPVPDRPAGIRVESRGYSEALGWHITFGADWGSDVDHASYDATSNRDERRGEIERPGNSHARVRLTHLDPNAMVSFYLRYCNRFGCGASIHRRAFTGPPGDGSVPIDELANEAPEPPRAPGGLVATRIGGTSFVRLTWSEPVDPIDFIEVRQRIPQSGACTPAQGCWQSARYEDQGPDPRIQLEDYYLGQTGLLFAPGYQVRRCLRGGAPPTGVHSCSSWSNLAEPS